MVEHFAFVVFVPGGAGGFEQIERSDDVGVEEVAGVFNGTVNVGFGREMDDVGGLEICYRLAEGFGIGEVDTGEFVVGIFRDRF